MLKKRTSSMKKDQQMCQITFHGSSASAQIPNQKPSFFSLPHLFVGLNPKNSSDYSDFPVNSPTSPLDFRVFSNPIRSPRSPHGKISNCSKVGLGIIEFLDDGQKVDPGIVTGPQLRIRVPEFGNSFRSFGSLDGGGKLLPGKLSPKYATHFQSYEAPRSLPKNFAFTHSTRSESRLQKGSSGVVFEIGESKIDCSEPSLKPRSCSSNHPTLDQESSKLHEFSRTIPSSESEMELSEDYTCVTVHGPNPKTTHIFADCILECKSGNSSYGSLNSKKGKPGSASGFLNNSMETADRHPSCDFLSSCNMCMKKLVAGKDIYIYRGEKAFCSSECRVRAILIDEGKEGEDSFEPEYGHEFSESDILKH